MSGLSRRTLLNLAFAGAAATTLGTAAVIRSADAADIGKAAGTDTSEVYKGRLIRITGAATAPDVSIDGRPLHIMITPDGRFVTAMNHYQRFGSAAKAARAAVDALGHHQLRLSHHHS